MSVLGNSSIPPTYGRVVNPPGNQVVALLVILTTTDCRDRTKLGNDFLVRRSRGETL